jgi:hypothetical protein
MEVHAEAMLTQLVFEHSLRIRFTEDPPATSLSKPVTAIVTPEAREPTSEAFHFDEASDATEEEESTIRASSTRAGTELDATDTDTMQSTSKRTQLLENKQFQGPT